MEKLAATILCEEREMAELKLSDFREDTNKLAKTESCVQEATFNQQNGQVRLVQV